MELTTQDNIILQEALKKIMDNHKISVSNETENDHKAESFYYDVVTTIEDLLRYLKGEL